MQEALTNTLKHAGPGAQAHVTLSFAVDGLAIEVADTGRAAARAGGEGGGLRGMRERAAVYDGIVEAGPRDDGGGWRVRTRLAYAGAPAAGAPA